MNHVPEFAVGKRETAHIAGMERYRRIGSQMRTLLGKSVGISREDRQFSSKAEVLIDVTKALNQPATEEACSAGKEEALPAHLLPQRTGLSENQIEILLCDSICWHG